MSNNNVKTLLSKLIDAHLEATGKWMGADWTHENSYETDEQGEHYPVYCDGGNLDGCRICREADSASDAAEEYAQEAVDAANSGDYDGAMDLAQKASYEERHFGDDPTWARFAKAAKSLWEASQEGVSLSLAGWKRIDGHMAPGGWKGQGTPENASSEETQEYTVEAYGVDLSRLFATREDAQAYLDNAGIGPDAHGIYPCIEICEEDGN